MKTIRRNAPGATLIWATITPMRTKADVQIFDAKTERIKARNQVAQIIISKQKNILIDDLWSLTSAHPEYYSGGDGVHPNANGYQAIGDMVAGVLADALERK